jgi:hypothetical protein
LDYAEATELSSLADALGRKRKLATGKKPAPRITEVIGQES